MAKGFSIRAWLGLDTKQFNKGVSSSKGKLTTFQKGLRGVNDTLRGLKFAAIGVTAIGAFSRLINTVKDFETNMARVKVITGASQESMEKLTDAARDIGATTRFSASEAAGGLQYLGMAGLTADQSLQALPATLNLAGAGMIDVGRSADMVTNVLSGFGLAVTEASNVSDIFAQASRTSNQTVDELYEGVKLIAPAYRNLGLSVEEAARDMALLANNGIKAEQAGTGLTGALSRLLRQPPLVANALKELGVQVTEQKIKQKGLIGVIQELRDAGVNATQMTQILGLHWKTTGSLISASDEQIQSMSDSMADFKGAAEDMSTNGIGSIDNAMKLLNSAIDELAISLGYEGGLSDMLVSIINGARAVVKWFTDMSNSTKLLSVAMTVMVFRGQKITNFLVSSATIVPKFIKALTLGRRAVKLFGLSFKTALGPIGLVSLAIEGVIMLISSFKSERDKLKDMAEDFKNFEEGIKNSSNDSLNDELKKQTDIKIKAWKEQEKAKNALNDIYARDSWASYQRQLDRETMAYDMAQKKIQTINAELWRREEEATAKELADIAEKAAQEEARREAARIALVEEEAAYRRALKTNETQLKTIEDIENLEKDLKAFRKRANKEDLMAIDRKLDRLKEYKSLLEGSYNGEKLDSPEPVSLKGDTKIGIDTKELQDLDGINSKLAETKTLMGEMGALDAFGGLINRSRFAAGALSALKEHSYGLAESLKETSEEGADNFGDLGKSLGNAAREAIRASIARGVAGALASSFEALPFPLNIIGAPIAAAAASTAFNSLIPAFATGGVQDVKNGIFQGSSLTGDRNLARVNAREMVLTMGQQRNLFEMANRGVGGSGNVEFVIKGDKLVGVLNNANTKRRKST